MRSNSFAIVSFATAMLKMKTVPTGFPVALCNTAIQSCDRHTNRSFLLVRIADFVVDAVDVVDVLVSEIAAFPPSEHLAFSSPIFLLHKVFLTFLICNRLVSNIGIAYGVPELSEPSDEGASDESSSKYLPVCEKFIDAELIDILFCAEKQFDVSVIAAESSRLLTVFSYI